MLVRPGGPEDVDAVVALVAAVDGERGEAFDEEAFRALLRDAALFVAEAGGEIVGNLGLHGGGRDTASIGMSVARPWRRRGVGTALIEAASEWARDRGLRRLTLEVLADNSPALALYRRLGFKEESRRSGGRGQVVAMSRAVERSP